jgi:hypothetical protein
MFCSAIAKVKSPTLNPRFLAARVDARVPGHLRIDCRRELANIAIDFDHARGERAQDVVRRPPIVRRLEIRERLIGVVRESPRTARENGDAAGIRHFSASSTRAPASCASIAATAPA